MINPLALAVLVMTVSLSACSTAPQMQSKPAAPLHVLIIGDSISMNYTPRVRSLLGDGAVVVRPTLANGRAENCAGTNNGIKHIDRWLQLDGGDWDVIHFNFGLHDIKQVHPETGKTSRDPAHGLQAPLPLYVQQLTNIVDALESTGATLIFATTTPVPEGRVSPYRNVNDAARYNAAAVALMESRGIAVNDLYAFALPRLVELQKPANVHFTREGSKALGQVVAETIQAAVQ
jgi:acyl-CoA thioesterase-1